MQQQSTLKIKPKDSTAPVYYHNVLAHYTEGNTLAVLFQDGAVRNFPLQHIWYYESYHNREKTKTAQCI